MMYVETTVHYNMLLMLIGLAGLWLSSGFIIDHAVLLAKRLGIHSAFIGLTILSIGTSLAEMATHTVASLDILKGGDGTVAGIAVGTNIGSNTMQITFILGVIGLLALVKSNREIMKRDYPIMLGSIVLVWILALNGMLSRLEGWVLMMLYAYYLYYLTKQEKVMVKVKNHKKEYKIAVLNLILMCVGLGILIFAAKMVVDNAILISEFYHIRGTFMGTVIVGVCTALPEFTTALRGILKGAQAISLGTLVGSNITNPLLALGLGAAISGYAIDKVILFLDIPFWFGVSILVYFFFTRGLRLFKSEAVTLILLYLAYVFVKFRYFAFF